MLADLPLTAEDIEGAILELAAQINLEEQQKMTMNAQLADQQALVQMQQVQTNL